MALGFSSVLISGLATSAALTHAQVASVVTPTVPIWVPWRLMAKCVAHKGTCYILDLWNLLFWRWTIEAAALIINPARFFSLSFFLYLYGCGGFQESDVWKVTH